MGKQSRAMANGRSNAGLSASTTIPLGLAGAIVLGALGGVWYAASTLTALSSKVDYLTNDVNGVRNNVTSMQTDLANIKKSVDRIEWATSSDTTKKR